MRNAPFFGFDGFLPDLDPVQPGIITDCDNAIPTFRGYRAMPSPVSIGASALPDAAKGLYTAKLTDDSKRVFAGTETALYELSGTTWTDRSRAGSPYSTTLSRWRFAQVGDLTLAVNKSDLSQQSISSGDFSDLTAMPRAAHIATALGWVAVGNTDDPVYGDEQDRWRLSALENPFDWVPSTATQSATGRLTDTPGGFSCLRSFGDDLLYFKQRAMYQGTLIGGADVIRFRRVSDDIGCVGGDAAATAGYNTYFLGYDDFYVFDGSIPRPIGAGIKNWFFSRIARDYLDAVQAGYDRGNATIYWWYSPTDAAIAGALTEFVAFNLITQKWGRGSIEVEAVNEYLNTSMTYDQFGVGGTWDDLPDIPYDSSFWQASAPQIGVFNASHELCTLTGVAGSSSLTTGWNGNDQDLTKIRRVIPRWFTAPAAATMTHRTMNFWGDTIASMSPSTMNALKRFDILRAARWHSDVFAMTGDWEMPGVAVDRIPSGKE